MLQIGGVGLPGPIAVSGLPATEVTHDEPPQPPVQPPAPAPPLQPSQLEPTQPSQPPPSQPQPPQIQPSAEPTLPQAPATPGPTPRVPPPPPAAPSEPGAPPPCYVDFVVTLPDCDMASFDDAKRERFAAGVAKSLGIDAAKVTAQPCAGSVVVRTRVHVADVQGAADLAKRLADPERAAALVDSREFGRCQVSGLKVTKPCPTPMKPPASGPPPGPPPSAFPSALGPPRVAPPTVEPPHVLDLSPRSFCGLLTLVCERIRKSHTMLESCHARNEIAPLCLELVNACLCSCQ